MAHATSRRVCLALDLAQRGTPPGPAPPDELCCLGCGTPLLLHQPDWNDPARLLATCEPCGCWHLLFADAEGADATLVRLPDAAQFREAAHR